jgi:Tol biopolymer transport system component
MMKSITPSILILLSSMMTGNISNAHDELSAPEGPYLGQKLPGLTPEIFAPGLVSTEQRDGSGFFSPDMKEFYFTRKNINENKWSLIGYKFESNRWQKASVVPRVGRPTMSPDGKIMHLGKQYIERTDDGWSEIKSLGPPYEEIRIMRLMSSSKGTYVLDEGTRDGNGVLRYSRLLDGKREEPKPFGKEINTGKWNAHPYIAPDESYLIWDGERDDGFGDNDLYVSFRQLDGSWGEAINMGDKVNTDAPELGASVTPDGKYLFFNRNTGVGDFNKNAGVGDGDLYWVDAQIIENLRPKL